VEPWKKNKFPWNPAENCYQSIGVGAEERRKDSAKEENAGSVV